MQLVRPKVMHIISGLGVGGAESMLTALVTAARVELPRQIVVDLLASEYSVNTNRIKEANIPLYSLKVRSVWAVPRTIRRLSALIRDEQPDVIQTWMHYADMIGTLALRKTTLARRPRLYWGVRCSELDFSNAGYKMRLVLSACRRLSTVPQAIVTNSEAGRRAHGALGYPDSKFAVIPNGIDTGRFKPDTEVRRVTRKELGLSPDARLVVMAARVDPMKDHGSFLAMLDRMPDITGLAVGHGTESLPRRKNLLTPGIWQDMPKLYSAADLVVSPSAYGEGFSNVIGEAMATGTPVVATDVGDARMIVGDTGVIVPPRDPDALTGAARTLLDEPRAQHEARRRAARRRIVERYSLDRAVAAFDTLHRAGRLLDAA